MEIAIIFVLSTADKVKATPDNNRISRVQNNLLHLPEESRGSRVVRRSVDKNEPPLKLLGSVVNSSANREFPFSPGPNLYRLITET
jgi:hypothetical protein